MLAAISVAVACALEAGAESAADTEANPTASTDEAVITSQRYERWPTPPGPRADRCRRGYARELLRKS